MNKILIGSSAMKFWYSGFKRIPKDIDYAVDQEIKSSNPEVEYLYNPILFKYTSDEVLSPQLLLTLKMSHIFWDTNFDKHMWDIQFLLEKGIRYNEEVFLDLYNFWKDYLPKVRRSNLNMSADDFFNNALPDSHLHDSKHEVLIKHPYFENQPKPTYTLVLKDGKEVEPDFEKFKSLSHKQKLNLVLEEVMVMDFERFVHLKFPFGYAKMLRKFLQTHAPLWEAIFIIENWIELFRPKFNHYKHFENELQVPK